MAGTNTQNLCEKCAARGGIETSGDERQTFCSQIFGVWTAKHPALIRGSPSLEPDCFAVFGEIGSTTYHSKLSL